HGFGGLEIGCSGTPRRHHGTDVQSSSAGHRASGSRPVCEIVVSVIPAVIRVVALAPLEALPGIASGELRARPVERGVAAPLRPACPPWQLPSRSRPRLPDALAPRP